jgi:hypothetical protein
MCMARSIRITLSPSMTQGLIAELRKVPGLVGMALQPGAALSPPGDVLIVDSTTRALPGVMRVLEDKGVLRDPASTVTTSEPESTVSASAKNLLVTDSSDASLEEMEYMIARESNMTVNGMLLMMFAGVIATIGLLSGAVHLVIGAMVIAPGFEPLSRVGLGIVGRSAAWRRGLVHTFKGYAVLIAASALTALLYRLLATPPSSPYQMPDALVPYWSTVQPSSLVVSLIAGTGGALLIATHRSVLTAGTMIGLGLIPAAALVGIGAVALDASLVARGLLRLSLEMALVVMTAVVVFGWKRARLHRRRLAV